MGEHEDRRERLARRIRDLRRRANRTQEQLAQAVGVRQATICNWEKGRTSPSSSLLVALCLACNATPDDLYEEFADPRPDQLRLGIDPEARRLLDELARLLESR